MSKKIARLLQGRELLLGNEIVEGQPSVNFKDSGTLLVPEIMEYPEELTGGNLISEREPKEITANSNDWKYIKIYYGLKKNTTYTFSSDVEVLKGDITHITVYPYLRSGESMSHIKVPIVDGKIITTFTTDGRYDYNLLVYAGLAGHTSGNSIRLTNCRLREGSIEDEWGRNLLLNSGGKYLKTPHSAYKPEIVIIDDKNAIVFNSKKNMINWKCSYLTLVDGEEYTFSFLAKGDRKMSLGRVYLNSQNSDFLRNTIVTTEWQKYSFTFTAVGNDAVNIHMYPSKINDDGTMDGFYLTELKLEKGTKATDWTPAPEDLGLYYPDDIQSFGFNILQESILVVPELIEDYSFKEQ